MEKGGKELEEGLLLLAAEKYEAAFKVLHPLAKQQELKAQAAVGFMYQSGLGVERNIEKAIKWLEAAAKCGLGEAAHNLATLYLSCEPDQPKNPEKSRFWYKKAKELGFVTGSDDWYS